MHTNPQILTDHLYNLLPATYRLRDAEIGSPLRALIGVIAEQTAVGQEGLEQAYDDLFIETCAEWVVPYIGDLIGARPVHGKLADAVNDRAAVANTLSLRQRKGTIAALEQIAQDVTGYPAVAVEFFLRLALTQYMNHPRPQNVATLDLRDELALERLNSAFDRAMHTLEVRRIASRRGRYNISNIGVYLFRIRSFALAGVTAARVDAFRYTFNPLGIDTPLYNEVVPEVAFEQFAGPQNVPLPITRLAMKRNKAGFYGADASLLLTVNGTDIPESAVVVCDLRNHPTVVGAWAHAPADRYGVDPVLGRIALPTDEPAPAPGTVVVSYRYGFSDTIGGGSYERGDMIATRSISAAASDVQSAFTASSAGDVLRFEDSRTYTIAGNTPNLDVRGTVVVRARNGERPVLHVTGGALHVTGAPESTLEIDGLVLTGGTLRITGDLMAVTLRHCTLVPGSTRTSANEPAQPDVPSLVIASETVTVTLDSCITGPIEAANGCQVVVKHTIIDAGDETRLAYSGPEDVAGGTVAGGLLEIENSTVIGRVHALGFERASNVIFVARAVGAALPVRVERTQTGCVRFSVVPPASRTPRRYHCVTEAARFTSTTFGMPGYLQLSAACAESIRRGADDESEMGVYHDLYHPLRESDLRTRMNEFLRFGMEAGIFFAS